MLSSGVIEPFDVVEHFDPAFISGSVDHRFSRSVFNVEKKLSMAALSQQSPRLLILHTIPASASGIWNCSLVYWLP